MARRGAGSNGAKAPISAAKSAAWSGAVLIGRSAGEPLLLVGGALLDVARRAREVAVEPGEGTAGIRLLPELAQGHAELEQVVGSLPALGIFLIALGEDRGGVVVVLPHVIGLAQPVLGVAGERIIRGALHEGAQRLPGPRGIGLAQQAEGVVVLLLRRPARRRGGSSRPRRRRRGGLVAADSAEHARLARPPCPGGAPALPRRRTAGARI